MCSHGYAVDLGQFCPDCLGPRDRRDPGTGVAADVCPFCGWRTLTPVFGGHEYTTVVLICQLCGGES